MNILAAAAILHLMIDPVCAQTNEANPEKRLTGKPPPAIQNLNISRGDSRPSSQAAADRFTGSVRVDPLFKTNESARASGAYVTFAPGARSASGSSFSTTSGATSSGASSRGWEERSW